MQVFWVDGSKNEHLKEKGVSIGVMAPILGISQKGLRANMSSVDLRGFKVTSSTHRSQAKNI